LLAEACNVREPQLSCIVD